MDDKQSWVRVASSDEVGEEQAIEVIVKQRIIAVFRNDGELHALDGMCAHQGGPIAKGEISGGCVTCPWHGWQYELHSGIQMINRKPLQQVFPVREVNGQIEIAIEHTTSDKSST